MVLDDEQADSNIAFMESCYLIFSPDLQSNMAIGSVHA